MANPAWTEEELILAYHVCKKLEGQNLSSDMHDVIALSEQLNRLPIHDVSRRDRQFRNPDGVRRRINYLRQIERGEEVKGRDLYKEVVSRYCDAPNRLEIDANRIRERYRASK